MVDVTALAGFLLQGLILGLFVTAIRRGNEAAAINAFVAFVITILPVAVDVVFRVVLAQGDLFGPVLPIWIAAAGVLHSLGMLGLYESTWWWDHVTHTVSAALVAALVYAGFIVTFPDLWGDSAVPGIIATVGFTFAIGVFWELIELVARELGDRFDIEPVLVHYGWRDTAVDLLFDVVGALLVIGFDVRLFAPVLDRVPVATRIVLIGTGGLVIGGGVLMALFVWFGRSKRM